MQKEINSKIQMAVDMLKISVINSREYAKTVESAYWSPDSNKPLK